MNNKLLSLLGIARRAGRISLGFDAAVDSVHGGQCKLLLLANDLSERTKRAIVRTADDSKVKTVFLDIPMEELGASVGKLTGIISVNDQGFADKMITLCNG